MKQDLGSGQNKKTSHLKRGHATVIGMPITYDEKSKVYKFQENSLVSASNQAKHKRHTCDKIGIADQQVNPGGANLVIPTLNLFISI